MLNSFAWIVGLVVTTLMIFVFTSLGLGWMLVRRRPPDPPDDPGRYGVDYETVKFTSRYKVTLHGWWIPASEPRGTLIVCHGQNGSMAGDLPLAMALQARGYNILMYDQRAHGESQGDYLTYGVFEKEDLLGAIDYLQAEKNVGKVAVLGLSMGASVAVIAASLTHQISALVVDGIYDRFVLAFRATIRQILPLPILPMVLAEMGVLGASIITNTRMFQVSPFLWMRHIRNVPVLFIHCENDHIVSGESIESLAADLPPVPHKIWQVPGCGHRGAFEQHPEAYVEQVVAWLSEHHTPE